MEDGARPERVEIELTRRDESRRRWGRGGSADAEAAVAAPVPPTAPAESGHGPPWGPDSAPVVEPPTGVHSAPLEPTPELSGDGMRRLVVIAVATGAVALLLGWAIGRSGGDGDTATSIAPGTTQPPGGSTSVAPGSTLPVVDPADMPTTTRPPRTTTTTEPPKWTIEPISLDGRAIELGLRLVGVTTDGRLFDIDTAEGTIASIDTDVRAYNGAVVYAGDDWVLVGDFDRGDARVYRTFANEPERFPIGDLWSLRWQPDTDRFWVVDQSMYPGPLTISERTVDGIDTGVTFEVSQRFWPSGADPAGGVIVSGQTGTFRATPEGSERISTGYLLALSAERALAVECGDSLDTCGTYVVDRASGERTPLELDGSNETVVDSAANYGMYGGDLSRISPDGRYAPVVMPSSNAPTFGVVDLDRGTFTKIADYVQSPLLWTPDGRHAVFVTENQPWVFDAETGETFPLLAPGPSPTEFLSVAAIALRPPA